MIDDSDNINAKKAAINEFEWAEEAGYTLDNPDFQVLYMSNVESKIYEHKKASYRKMNRHINQWNRVESRN